MIANSAVKPTQQIASSTQRDVRANGSKLSGIRGSIAAVQANVSAQAASTRTWITNATQPLRDGQLFIQKQAAAIHRNSFVQAALNTMNTAFLVHNAARLG
ncbi:hypothetical protein Lepto7376_2384 [[Leptolyngbya] sp. PCC 7376]|uniref:hypothetical protein n=1 Tax=[Leptolyngbya] sp. PCC 7376 TaxID=111781 RepID=UPI00029F1110|nr:hypothetical protein [[Leptolyngbya] sp. PCC 7376]AFY38666.1 hypothetical protein Lepto7376_2384 [[Leptolyngbya] sp. PCC 7376]